MKICTSCNKFDENQKYLKVGPNALIGGCCLSSTSFNKLMADIQIKSFDFLNALAPGVYDLTKFEALVAEHRDDLQKHLKAQAVTWLDSRIDLEEDEA